MVSTPVSRRGGASPIHELPRPPYRQPSRGRLLQWLADFSGGLAMLSVAWVIGLWLSGGGIATLPETGGIATSLGRLSGLISADLLLLQVLLMARIPGVEAAFGPDRLARQHRWLGFVSFNLMLVHIVAITIGYAQVAGINVFVQIWDFLINYAGMLLAGAATIALVAVVVSSMRAARRKMRYESWHLVHLYAYVGVGLALPHQLWTGRDFLDSTAATIFWWSFWGAAAGAIVGFRLLLPVWRSLRYDLRVVAVIPEIPGVYSVIIQGRNLDRLKVRAGQFCQWRFLAGVGWSRTHPFSLSAPMAGNRLRITVTQVGDGTRGMTKLRPGTRVLFEGPYGAMTADRRLHRDVLLIGAGVGITPLRALAQELLTTVDSPNITVLQRVSGPRLLLHRAEFVDMSRTGQLRWIPLVGHRGARTWLPAGVPIPLPSDAANYDAYLCGPADWMRQVRRDLRAAGMPNSSIHAEDFAL